MKLERLIKKVEAIDREQRKKKFERFLKGFNKGHLRKIVDYYGLGCADLHQERCLVKSIRDSGLQYQQVWTVLISR